MYSGRTPDLPYNNNRNRNNIQLTGAGSNDSGGLNLNSSGGGSGNSNAINESDERTVYVKNLHENVTEDLLRELFIQVGPVQTLTIKEICVGRSRSYLSIEPPKNGAETPRAPPPQRFAFVTFEDQDSVLFACEMLDQTSLYGTRIRVKPRERTEKYRVYVQLGIERIVKERYLTTDYM